MNISLQLQEFDDLIVEHSRPPAMTVLRNKLHTIREQIEAHFATLEAESKTAAKTLEEHLTLKNAHSDLRKAYEQLRVGYAEATRPKSGTVRLVRG